jgi:hypothetical protein
MDIARSAGWEGGGGHKIRLGAMTELSEDLGRGWGGW